MSVLKDAPQYVKLILSKQAINLGKIYQTTRTLAEFEGVITVLAMISRAMATAIVF